MQLWPRPAGWTLHHLRKEDGSIFLTDFLERGWSSTFELYSGYTHLLPRLLTGIGVALPTEWITVWIGVATALVKVGVCLVAYPVLLRWIGSMGWASLAAVVPLFMPLGSQEVLGNFTNIRWYMAFVVFFIAWSVYERPGPNVALAAVGVVAVLTEPLTVAMLPLLAIRGGVNRGWSRLPSVVTLVAIVMNLVWVMSPGDRGGQGVTGVVQDPLSTLQQLMLRGPAAAEFGVNFSKFAMLRVGSWYWLAGLAVMLMLIWLTFRLRRESLPGAVFSWILIAWGFIVLSATMAFTDYTILDIDQWYTIGQTSRYSASASLYLLTGMIGIIGLTFMERDRKSLPTRLVAGGVLGVLVVAMVADFPGDEWNFRGPLWSDTVDQVRAQCAAGTDPVVVPITPQGVPANWAATIPCSALG